VRRFTLVFVLFLAATPQGQAGAQASGANVLQNIPPEPAEQLGQDAGNRPDGPRLPLTADALQGPPNPATMYALTGMNDGQFAQYLAAYRAHMAATWSTRVATMSALNMMGRAVKNSDAEAVRYYHLLTDQLWAQLRNQDRGFDTALGALLKEKQLESYHRWKAAWERGSRARQRLQAMSIEQAMLIR
jgi:hypothetical protein